MTVEQIEELCASQSSADFFKVWIKIYFPKSSLEVLARKCQISSKSTIHDLLSGRRKASLSLITSLCLGLKVRGPEKKLLLKLWEQEKNPEVGGSKESFLLRQKVKEKNSKLKSKYLPLLEGWDYVYASLGPSGATLERISSKSLISKENCLRILEKLIDYGLVSFNPKNSSYSAKAVHSIFEEFSVNEKEYLNSKIKTTHMRLQSDFGNLNETLFRHYFFSISKGNYLNLRKKLVDLLDEYADESEVGEGDEIVDLLVAFNLKK